MYHKMNRGHQGVFSAKQRQRQGGGQWGNWRGQCGLGQHAWLNESLFQVYDARFAAPRIVSCVFFVDLPSEILHKNINIYVFEVALSIGGLCFVWFCL